MMNLVFAVLAAAGAGIIWLLIRAVRRSATRLDQRIEEYREEGPPTDPYGELARLLQEDAASRRTSIWRRKAGRGDSN